MQNLKKRINQVIGSIACLVLSFMVLVATWQVFTRYVLDSPSTVSEEILRFSLIWVALLGTAYAFGNKKHIAIEFILEKLSKKKVLVMSVTIEAIVLVFAIVVMIIGGWKTVDISMAQSASAIGIPMGLVYLSLPVSGLFITSFSLLSIYETLRNRKVELYSEDVESAIQPHIKS